MSKHLIFFFIRRIQSTCGFNSSTGSILGIPWTTTWNKKCADVDRLPQTRLLFIRNFTLIVIPLWNNGLWLFGLYSLLCAQNTTICGRGRVFHSHIRYISMNLSENVYLNHLKTHSLRILLLASLWKIGQTDKFTLCRSTHRTLISCLFTQSSWMLPVL